MDWFLFCAFLLRAVLAIYTIHPQSYSDGCVREQHEVTVLLEDILHAGWSRRGSNHEPSG